MAKGIHAGGRKNTTTATPQHPPESATAAAASDLDMGYLLIILGFSSFSSSTGAGTDEETAALGVALWFLGLYWGGRGKKR